MFHADREDKTELRGGSRTENERRTPAVAYREGIGVSSTVGVRHVVAPWLDANAVINGQ